LCKDSDKILYFKVLNKYFKEHFQPGMSYILVWRGSQSAYNQQILRLAHFYKDGGLL
jgi:hypothetical protein